MGGTETVHEHREHCCDTGRVKGVLILGVGLYVRVLIREVPFFLLRGVSL